MIENFIDWDKLWNAVLKVNKGNLEDFEPTLRNCAIEEIEGFFNHSVPMTMNTVDCELNGNRINIPFYEESFCASESNDTTGCAYIFTIDYRQDLIITHVEYESW